MNTAYESPPLTVTDLNRHARHLLESAFGRLTVLGELSNCVRASSGHLYFSLKDDKAQIRCVFFRNAHTVAAQTLEDGQQVIAVGQLSLYEPRGDYQLIVKELHLAGLGLLYQQFEALKKRLSEQGLFAAERKKAIPRFPQTIGIITSPTGAALHDIITTLKRRYPLARLIVYPSEVQGKNAAKQLIQALQAAYHDNRADVLILARGGGSLEDLWPFNDEKLAYTIAESHLPIVSGVGHETDFTIADFVADKRAATPTAAAEAVTPDRYDLMAGLQTLAQRMATLIRTKIQVLQIHLSHHQTRVSTPKNAVFVKSQAIDYLEKQMHTLLATRLHRLNHRLALIGNILQAANVRMKIQQHQEQLTTHRYQLDHSIYNQILHSQQQFSNLTAKIHALSPLATLQRGYAIASQQGHVLMDIAAVNPKEAIDIQLAHGHLVCVIKKFLAD